MTIDSEIKRLSARNTIEGAPKISHDPPKIPTDLFEILEHNLEPYEKMTPTSEHYMKIIKGLKNFTSFTPDIYWFVWKLILYLEQYQGIVECRKYALYNKSFQVALIRRGEFILYVPGLEEQRPSICIRDFVDICAVDGSGHCVGEVKFIGENYISVAVDSAFKNYYYPDKKFDITFRWHDWEINNINYALDKVRELNLMKTLFPLGGRDTPPLTLKLFWRNRQIAENPQQQQAINNILVKSAQPDPYVLFGPPGTGKTATLIEAILQIHERNTEDRILICTPSNAASDEIALKLVRHIPEVISPSAIYRMYSASRGIEDIPENLKPYSNFVGEEVIFPSKELFISKSIVIVTLSSAIRVYNYELKGNHFSYLFIDEAGQAMEPQMLVPFLIMCGHKAEKNVRPHGQIIIAGDPMQLGPACQSRIAEPILSISMLERLMSWGPYKRISGLYNQNYVTKLIRNYRCHPKILEIPNQLFYDGELEACGGHHTSRVINWHRLPNPNFPVLFHAVTGDEEREPHSPSVFNPAEVEVVLGYVRKLLNDRSGGLRLREENIGIVTPYRLQRAKINNALERENIKNLSVGTVEIFQGQERDVIIISTVRSVMYKANGEIHIGFLSNPKRFNVALTRAKALLIVIGNPKILQYDDKWREFMQYCMENGSWNGPAILLDRQLSRREMNQHRGKKHRVIRNTDPQENLPVVEDPTSARNYDATQIEEAALRGRRRRRLPSGISQGERIDNYNSFFHKTMERVHDFDGWMNQQNFSDDESGGKRKNYEDLDRSDGEDIFNDISQLLLNDRRKREQGNNLDMNNDDVLEKFRKRIEKL